MSRRPPAVHGLIDMWPYEAVVRCDEGDVETFMRLAADHAFVGKDVDPNLFEIAPPNWRWFRMNPCGGECGEHGWHIGGAAGPGPGNWCGSYVKLVRRSEAGAR